MRARSSRWRTTWQRRSSRALRRRQSPLIAMFTAGCLNIVPDLCCSLSASAGYSGRCRRDTARAAVCIRVLRHCAGTKSRLRPSKAGLAAGQQCDPGGCAAFVHAARCSILSSSSAASCRRLSTPAACVPRGFTATNKLHGSMDCSASAFRLRRRPTPAVELGRKPA